VIRLDWFTLYGDRKEETLPPPSEQKEKGQKRKKPTRRSKDRK
jgi:hypothetical protein